MSSDEDGAPQRGPVSAAEARARVESQRAERKAARDAHLAQAFGDSVPGRPTIWASWTATVLLVAVSLLALVDEDRFLGAFTAVTLVLFGIGSALFAVDLVLAVARSTRDAMGIGGLFFCIGSAPRAVSASLNASLGAAVTVSIVVVALRLSTPEFAFGTLAPILQLALTGFWGVRHGRFEPRSEGPGTASTRGSSR